jgi:chaperonin GroEL
MTSNHKFNKEARESMVQGIKKIYDAVRITFGPKGRNVIIDEAYGPPLIINDGATIARSINLSNRWENLGSSLIIEAASKTNELVGDGTTTAIILASVLIFEGLKKVEKGVNPVHLKNGLGYLLPLIIQMIDDQKIMLSSRDELLNIAINSSNDQDISKLILQALDEVGADGLINILESNDAWTHLEITKGYRFDRSYVSPYMASDQEKMQTILERPLILITNKKISLLTDILWALETAVEKGYPLLIICDDIEQEVISSIIINNLNGVFNVVVVKAPSFGEYRDALLQDLSILTGAAFLNENSLGSAQKVIIQKEHTTIIDGCGLDEELETHLRSLKHQLDYANQLEKEKIKTRIAKLTSGIALIKVGAATDIELQEKKLKYEDALNATKSALKDGIVEGAGKVFYLIGKRLDNLHINSDYQDAKAIMSVTLKAPFHQIVENGGYHLDAIIHDLTDELWFDALTGEKCLLRDRGIIDPVQVLKTSLMNAVSIASMFLTTECAIILKNIDKTIDKTINEENLL